MYIKYTSGNGLFSIICYSWVWQKY